MKSRWGRGACNTERCYFGKGEGDSGWKSFKYVSTYVHDLLGGAAVLRRTERNKEKVIRTNCRDRAELGTLKMPLQTQYSCI